MKVFVHDVSICNGCYNCQIACKDEHVANDWTPYAKPQPEVGAFWLKLTETVRGQVPRVKVAYVPILCNHCDNAPCMAACKAEGVIYKREDGLVIIDPVKCTGCRNCVDACPYGVIYFNDGLNIAQKCTGCAHLIDSGWKEPRCVDACPTQALKFMEEDEAREYIGKGEYLKPERKDTDGVRVHYLNLPRRFIAGTVYDPVKKEVIIGADVTLSDAVNGKKTYTARTDDFGDFEFEKLPVSQFTLTIRSGAVSREIKVNTEQDISLGDIPLNPSYNQVSYANK
ncbi:MAG: 4Fe-4S dicluster domain-containing protein [Dehalococcoidales bacterium]|nr:4Fe-4S dicluster domain-containing protein [Dehalococcoidales bacterium]